MAQVGLEDTSLNRDAAMEEMFRAQADTLLTSANDPRKPKLTATGLAEQMRVQSGPGAPPPRSLVLWQGRFGCVGARDGGRHRIAAGVSPEPFAVQERVDEVTLPKARTTRKDLPLSEFDAQVEAHRKPPG